MTRSGAAALPSGCIRNFPRGGPVLLLLVTEKMTKYLSIDTRQRARGEYYTRGGPNFSQVYFRLLSRRKITDTREYQQYFVKNNRGHHNRISVCAVTTVLLGILKIDIYIDAFLWY